MGVIWNGFIGKGKEGRKGLLWSGVMTRGKVGGGSWMVERNLRVRKVYSNGKGKKRRQVRLSETKPQKVGHGIGARLLACREEDTEKNGFWFGINFKQSYFCISNAFFGINKG